MGVLPVEWIPYKRNDRCFSLPLSIAMILKVRVQFIVQQQVTGEDGSQITDELYGRSVYACMRGMTQK